MTSHPQHQSPFDEPLAASFAALALANVARPFPHKLDHLLVAGPDPTVADHVALHPVFFGSYDWHSSVHMHWLLVRLLRLHPRLPLRSRILDRLDEHLTVSRIAVERAYCSGPSGRTFERPYGWAWLLELRAELERLAIADPGRRPWAEALDPLADDLATRMAAFVAAAAYPVRSGVHSCTAFALLLSLDHARTCGREDLEKTLTAAACRWHAADRDAPVGWEPSLTDFLSPSLAIAALMQATLPATDFPGWLAGFMPYGLGPLAEPPLVTDHSDAQITHLDGLALSRAWMLRRIAGGIPGDDSLREALLAAAAANLAAGMPHAFGGDYVGEHWLASFAALALGSVP